MNIPETSVPPHDDDAEQAVLGAILLDWDSLDTAASLLRPERFYSKRNQIIFDAMLDLNNKNTTADSITLINQLKENKLLDQAGGPAYIAELTSSVPSSANIEYYSKMVLDRALRRELIKLTYEMRTSSYDIATDAQTILGEAESKLFVLAEHNETATISNMKDSIIEGIGYVEKAVKSKGQITGVPSGFAKLDALTSGFHEAEFIVIGARPSIGKTALALSMMKYIAFDKSIPCGFFSLEMPRLSITQRLMAMESNVDMSRVRNGLLKLSEIQRIQDAAGKMFEKPLYLVDTPNMHMLDIKSLARRMKKTYDIQILFIDYIGLITPDKPHPNSWEDVAEISKQLKALARELNIPIVALSQLGREAEVKGSNIAQLRGSGAIEQDADVVMLLERERIMPAPPTQPAVLNLAKQRNGSTGPVNITWVSSSARYDNSIEDND